MNARKLFGLILLLLGVLFTLDILNILDFNLGNIISTWWPLIFVFIGISQFKSGSNTSGLIFTLIGVIIIVNNLNIFDVNFWTIIFPLLLVSIGLHLLFTNKKSSSNSLVNDKKKIQIDSIFSGSNQVVSSKDIESLEVFALFGGVQLDMREAGFSPNLKPIDLTAVFGGIEITVPSNCQVIVKGSPIFGGIENRTQNSNLEENYEIILDCTAVFGGIEIKS